MSKRGISMSAGVKGAHVVAGTSGARVSAGVPGTGAGVTWKAGGNKEAAHADAGRPGSSYDDRVLGFKVIVFCVGIVAFVIWRIVSG